MLGFSLNGDGHWGSGLNLGLKHQVLSPCDTQPLSEMRAQGLGQLEEQKGKLWQELLAPSCRDWGLEQVKKLTYIRELWGRY